MWIIDNNIVSFQQLVIVDKPYLMLTIHDMVTYLS